MRARLLAAGLAAAAIFPSAAFAQVSCEQQNKSRTTNTVAGGGLGAILGSAVAGSHDRATGAIIGAIGGALLANQLSKAKADCAHAYGYYDGQGAWHANADRSEAVGYFDRSGQWVNGAPSGLYDSRGQWQTTQGANGGYNDRNGHWVPSTTVGYYDADNRWVAPTTGFASTSYDGGRDNGARDHGDNGRQSTYDSGRWQGSSNDGWNNGDQHDVRTREDFLRQRIAEGRKNGDLSRSETRKYLARLQAISDHESRLPHRHGRLSDRDERQVQAQLDELSSDLRRQIRR